MRNILFLCGHFVDTANKINFDFATTQKLIGQIDSFKGRWQAVALADHVATATVGLSFIRHVSFENIIEERKSDCDRALMDRQKKLLEFIRTNQPVKVSDATKALPEYAANTIRKRLDMSA